jgi:hypothetical protein
MGTSVDVERPIETAAPGGSGTATLTTPRTTSSIAVRLPTSQAVSICVREKLTSLHVAAENSA